MAEMTFSDEYRRAFEEKLRGAPCGYRVQKPELRIITGQEDLARSEIRLEMVVNVVADTNIPAGQVVWE